MKKAVPVVRTLADEERDWLVQRSPRSMSNILEMHKRFHTDYPAGAILRQ